MSFLILYSIPNEKYTKIQNKEFKDRGALVLLVSDVFPYMVRAWVWLEEG